MVAFRVVSVALCCLVVSCLTFEVIEYTLGRRFKANERLPLLITQGICVIVELSSLAFLLYAIVMHAGA